LRKSLDFIPYEFQLLAEWSKNGGNLAAAGLSGKYYRRATTNAADGPSNPARYPNASPGIRRVVLSIHGRIPMPPGTEAPSPRLKKILDRCLARIVLEHLTQGSGGFRRQGPKDWPRRSRPPLLFTIDDMMGAGLNPHLFCKPPIKSAADRRALRNAAFSGSPKFFFGSDSAPHARAAKESARAPGGVYSSPTAIPALLGLFESEGALEALKPFIASSGARFYRLPAPQGRLRLLREP
jgi:dihydroorotase